MMQTLKCGAKTIKKKIEGKKIIFITHGPPYGTKIDLLGTNYAGNKSYTNFIKKEKPILALCGHLHENFGKTDQIGPSKLMNPGPEGEIIDI